MFRSLALIFGLASPAFADPLNVVTDISPIHSLVAQVMGETGEPALILKSVSSPHSYSMTPREAATLATADVVFWVGEPLTPWMERSISALSEDATVVELLLVKGTILHEFRTEVDTERHDADANQDHGHDEHGHDEQGHEAHADDEHADDVHADDEHGHDDHTHEGIDPHAWLDPQNAAFWLTTIAETLAQLDDQNAKLYKENATDAIAALSALEDQIRLSLPKDIDFAISHDNLQYFERRFNVHSPLAIADSDAFAPGPKRLNRIRRALNSRNIRCIIVDPTTNVKRIETLFEDHQVQQVNFDPLGSEFHPGPDLYPSLLRNLTQSLAEC